MSGGPQGDRQASAEPKGSTFHQQALAYAKEGIPVFPLRVRDKRPLIPTRDGGTRRAVSRTVYASLGPASIYAVIADTWLRPQVSIQTGDLTNGSTEVKSPKLRNGCWKNCATHQR